MRGASVVEPELATSEASGGARRIVQIVGTMAAWVAIVFSSAGRVNWMRGWICVAAYVLTMSVTGLLVHRANPGLMKQRAHLHWKDTKSFDRIFIALLLPLAFLQPALAGLDAARFHWSSMPFATMYAGLVLFEFAMGVITWAMMVNSHAESTVRIQGDRNHRTIMSGPYRFVRHPMYLGTIVMYPAAALMFGSLWALALSGVIAILFVWRTVMEDRTLGRELPGYEQYALSTRYRLLPGVW